MKDSAHCPDFVCDRALGNWRTDGLRCEYEDECMRVHPEDYPWDRFLYECTLPEAELKAGIACSVSETQASNQLSLF